MAAPNDRYVLSLDVENKSGVLTRITGLIAARGYNIESLIVAETLDETVSHITLAVRGDEWVIEQAVKQLNRLIDVIQVRDLTNMDTVDRELLMLQVEAKPESRAELLRMADIFRARVVDIAPTAFTFEVTGDPGKLDAFVELFRPYGIQRFMPSGQMAMRRAPKKDGLTQEMEPIGD